MSAGQSPIQRAWDSYGDVSTGSLTLNAPRASVKSKRHQIRERHGASRRFFQSNLTQHRWLAPCRSRTECRVQSGQYLTAESARVVRHLPVWSLSIHNRASLLALEVCRIWPHVYVGPDSCRLLSQF
ncbi:MAG: hypothetical protein JWN70_3223 [Planctomycetaceae bacterium]|nr:hypothetical protein [Planctomycetaceae bacterium]